MVYESFFTNYKQMFGYYDPRRKLAYEAKKQTKLTGHLHLPSFNGQEVISVEGMTTFLPEIMERRADNIKRVTYSEKIPLNEGNHDVLIDDQTVGKVVLNEFDHFEGAYSWTTKSVLALLHDYKVPWKETSDFAFLSKKDRTHIQLRQMEFVHELSVNESAAKKFYLSIKKAAQDLAIRLEKQGYPASSIFLGGGSALLIDPSNFPRQIDSLERILKYIKNPIPIISTLDFASTIFDVDMQIFGIEDPHKINWDEILGRRLGTIFSPLGLHPDEILNSFPDRIGLDIGIYPNLDLDIMILNSPISDKNIEVSLIRYPKTIKTSQIALASELSCRMIPLWWNPNNPLQKKKYDEAMQNVSKNHGLTILNKFTSKYPDIPIYQETKVLKALAERIKLHAYGGETAEQKIASL